MSFLYNLSHAICYSYGTDNKQLYHLVTRLSLCFLSFHSFQKIVNMFIIGNYMLVQI